MGWGGVWGLVWGAWVGRGGGVAVWRRMKCRNVSGLRNKVEVVVEGSQTDNLQ